jgi:cytochrome c556
MEAAVLELKTTSSYDRAAKAGDRLVESIPQITRYGAVGRDGLPIREKQDFKNWAAALATAAEDLRRATNNGDHEAAKAAQSEVDKACKGCHDVYGNRQW